MIFDNSFKKLPHGFFVPSEADVFSQPKLLAFNDDLAKQLDLEQERLMQDITDSSDTNVSFETASVAQQLAQIFSGQKLLSGSEPVSFVYAAHQFGHFVPQLGDGRAMLLGERVNAKGLRFDIQLKGSGLTDFSRQGDGLSALGPVIREYIVSEAMYHLGVPTTRALAAVATGEKVVRESLFPGAILTRVASSHLRIGSFQYFSAKNDIEGLKALLDYAVDRHYPFLREQNTSGKHNNLAVLFLAQVIKAQTKLVAKWMSLGFIHGVMNTDNMTISGETIDYGPCAFMDRFNFDQVYSYIDQQGRYAYANQEKILYWNVCRLADSLIPLLDGDEFKAVKTLNAQLELMPSLYQQQYLKLMLAKLGISDKKLCSHPNAEQLVKKWLNFLQTKQLDFTLSFRRLSKLVTGENDQSYFSAEQQDFKDFQQHWLSLLTEQGIDLSQVKENMDQVNPLYIPRNHLVEKAIQQSLKGDFTLFNKLNKLLKNPFTAQTNIDDEGIFQSLPEKSEEVRVTYCGT